MIDFRVHAIRAGGDEGGRTDFHRMLSALVGIAHPTATDMRPDPGDWGIDVYVGSLIDKVSIWQSKYFYTQVGASQKAQIRDSFASAMKNAAEHRYTVEAWTLCVACELSAPERRWWDGKVREWKGSHPNLNVDLWDAPRLRRMLMAPDAGHVAAEFYSESAPAPSFAATRPLAMSLEEPPPYEGALFVKQMEAAKIHELDGQRKAFFNADILVRDVQARAVASELAAVHEIDASLVSLWEDAVADPGTAPTAAEYAASARRLFATVMTRTQQFQGPAELPVRPMHVRGLMHRVVDDSRAGWVHDWRDIASDHGRAPEPQTEAGHAHSSPDDTKAAAAADVSPVP